MKTWCMNSDCKRCTECIRYQAFLQSGPDDQEIMVINPRSLQEGESCPHFAMLGKVTYAYGMLEILGRTPRDIRKKIIFELSIHFGRNPFYSRRKGERPMPPTEQEFILDTFRKYGITDSHLFDRYEECDEWIAG